MKIFAATLTLVGAVRFIPADLGPELTVSLGVAGGFLLAAVPVTYKLAKMESRFLRALDDHRRAIFGGESETGITDRLDNHARTLYGEHDTPHTGLVARVDYLETRRADRVRSGESHEPPARGSAS